MSVSARTSGGYRQVTEPRHASPSSEIGRRRAQMLQDEATYEALLERRRLAREHIARRDAALSSTRMDASPAEFAELAALLAAAEAAERQLPSLETRTRQAGEIHDSAVQAVNEAWQRYLDLRAIHQSGRRAGAMLNSDTLAGIHDELIALVGRAT